MGVHSRPAAIRLFRDSFREPPALDTAVSRAILQRVSEGTDPETLRLYRPGAIVAFGPKDRLAPGYREAVAAARRQGFASIQRLAGGRAAVFHEGTIAFSWVVPDGSPRTGIQARFEGIARIVAEAFRGLGIDARVGAVPGEYCTGDHSVNARGRTKLMGVGQRIIAHAAHVGGVAVVSESDRVRSVLIPVYRALGLQWDPDTVGSLEEEVPGITWEQAERAILEAFATRFELAEDHVSGAVLELARKWESQHSVDPSEGPSRGP